jgi:hypothetical protein
VQPGHGNQAELELGDDAEAALAAAQGPEQLGLPVRVGAVQLAVRGDDVDAADPLGRPAERPAEHRQPAAERVADDAGAGRRPGEAGQPVRRRRRQHVPPGGPGADRGGPRVRVDGDVVHPAGAEQQAGLDRRLGAVAGGLDGDRHAAGRRPPHRGDDVLGGRRADHDVGGVDGGQVEAGDLLGEAGIAGVEDRAVEKFGEGRGGRHAERR